MPTGFQPASPLTDVRWLQTYSSTAAHPTSSVRPVTYRPDQMSTRTVNASTISAANFTAVSRTASPLPVLYGYAGISGSIKPSPIRPATTMPIDSHTTGSVIKPTAIKPISGQASGTVYRPTTTVSAPASNSLLSRLGSWVWNQTSGLVDSARYSLPFATKNDGYLANRESKALGTAQYEYSLGVKEKAGSNRSSRIDMYARAADMSPGGPWCGYFVGYAYSQAGFKSASSMASEVKARCFFLYQTLSGHEDPAYQTQSKTGETRKFFMLPESPSQKYIKDNKSDFPQYNAQANTFNWWNLPVRAGDTVLFERNPKSGAYPTHVGMVESYNAVTGLLTTVEGNVNNTVVKRSYDLRNPSVRAEISGFGRPAPSDFA